MDQLIEFIPLLAFFTTYIKFGIYPATIVLMLASSLVFALLWFKNRKLKTMQIVVFVAILVFGGLTIIFQNVAFLKWKVTIVNWLLAGSILFSQRFTGKPAMKHLMGQTINLPDQIWKRLSVVWALFFFMIGVLNLYIAFNFDIDFWVKFKVFGNLGLTFVLTIGTVIYLARHAVIPEDDAKCEAKSGQES